MFAHLVLVAPLQLDHDRLAGETIEERLGVHGHRGHPESRLCKSEIWKCCTDAGLVFTAFGSIIVLLSV